MFKFSIAPSTAKEGFGFTIDLYTNPPIEPEAGRDFRLGLLNTATVRFSGNGVEGGIRYMALYIEFLAGKLGGYSKKIFKFKIKFYAANIPFEDFIFGAG